MRTDILAAALALALPMTSPQGGVTTVVVAPAAGGSTARVTIRGTNPCSQVFIDYGDGTSGTETVRALPATITHDYARPGTYQVRVRGEGSCRGAAAATVTTTAVAPNQDRALGQARFQAMDANNDGRITRAEWRGSAQSFRVHDWNGDGVLSGDEVRPGGRRQQTADDDFLPNRYPLDDWSERRFLQLDHNNDGRISRQEWHYDLEEFVRADRNRDGLVTRAEFLDTAFDDDRGDRFEFLDVNGNNRIERSEWHGSADAFTWLDRNNDGTLSRAEVVGEDPGSDDQFVSLDIDGDRFIALSEWHWSRASFTALDRNRDGRLTRAEFDAAGPVNATGASAPITVNANERWTDTGIYVQAGDTLTFNATGTIRMLGDQNSTGPAGLTGRRAVNAPLPEEAAGMLIARIGTWEPLPIGASRTITAPRAGRLYLGTNDDHLDDNSGTFRVTVTVKRK